MTAAGGDPLTGVSRLRDAMDEANTLLYYAISSGQDLPNTVRDPIIKLRTIIERGDPITEEDEGKFMDAYAKLALRSAPITAATLDATSRRHGRAVWIGRLFGLRPMSDAQRLVWRFGLLAVCLIILIAAGEWTLSFMTSLSTAEKQLSTTSQEAREALMRRDGIDEQIEMLKPSGTANAGAVRQALEVRKSDLTVKIWALEHTVLELGDSIDQ